MHDFRIPLFGLHRTLCNTLFCDFASLHGILGNRTQGKRWTSISKSNQNVTVTAITWHLDAVLSIFIVQISFHDIHPICSSVIDKRLCNSALLHLFYLSSKCYISWSRLFVTLVISYTVQFKFREWFWCI